MKNNDLRKPARNFQDLIVWQKAHKLVIEVYKFTENFPKTEIYCLTSQIRRSVISVPANIAEGFIKKSEIDKIRFLNIVQGSLEETRYYLILSNDLKYGESDKILPLLEEVSKLLNAFIKSIKNSL
jgi:four helix bundle protein